MWTNSCKCLTVKSMRRIFPSFSRAARLLSNRHLRGEGRSARCSSVQKRTKIPNDRFKQYARRVMNQVLRTTTRLHFSITSHSAESAAESLFHVVCAPDHPECISIIIVIVFGLGQIIPCKLHTMPSYLNQLRNFSTRVEQDTPLPVLMG